MWAPAVIPGVRYDAGVEAGSEVSVHYDPLLAKIIAHAPTRAEAIVRLQRALQTLAVGPVVTNRDFLLAVLDQPAFLAGELDTHFIERHLPIDRRQPAPDASRDRNHAIVAALFEHEQRRRAGGPLPASVVSGWRNNRWRPQDVAYLIGGDRIELQYVAEADGCFRVISGAGEHSCRVRAVDAHGLAVEIDGVRRRFMVTSGPGVLLVHGPLGTATVTSVPRFPPAAREDLAGGCAAPMTGIIREVRVQPGDRVEKGTVMLVLEAMKMEHQMTARALGVVRQVRVEVGQMVDPDEVLIVVEPVEPT
jgi:acetyl/propionyl-CoA carboxylase alpha subunit